MGFCLIVGVVWNTARKLLFHRETRANTWSLCNAYTPTLALSSFSVTYNSGSLLFLPHYFWKKSLFKKKKRKSHFIIIREARTFQSLILQSTLKIPTRKRRMRKLEGAKAGSGVISGDMRLGGRQNSNNLHEGERPICPCVVVLPVLLAPSALCWLLPRGASSFFPCYVWIHLSPFPKDRTWSGLINEITNLVFLMPSKYSQSPSDNPQDGESLWEHQPAPEGSRRQPDPAAARLTECTLSFLETKGIKPLYKSLCRKSFFVYFPRLMVCDSSCFIYGEIIWPHD